MGEGGYIVEGRYVAATEPAVNEIRQKTGRIYPGRFLRSILKRLYRAIVAFEGRSGRPRRPTWLPGVHSAAAPQA